MKPKPENPEKTDSVDPALHSLQLQVPNDLYRAFQRCTWIIINETGRSQVEIMEEMIRDFLIKHGC